jgi:hypothetical protein
VPVRASPSAGRSRKPPPGLIVGPTKVLKYATDIGRLVGIEIGGAFGHIVVVAVGIAPERVKPKRAVAQCWKDPKRDSREQDLRLPERERRTKQPVWRGKFSTHVDL